MRPLYGNLPFIFFGITRAYANVCIFILWGPDDTSRPAAVEESSGRGLSAAEPGPHEAQEDGALQRHADAAFPQSRGSQQTPDELDVRGNVVVVVRRRDATPVDPA